MGNILTLIPARSYRLKIALSAIVLFLAFAAGAQDDYYIFGVVKDKATFKKMEGIDITVLKDGKEFQTFRTSNSGKFDLYLPLGNDYIIQFEKPGFISKKVSLATKSIPEEDRAGGFETNLDMTLFAEVEGFDKSILDQPIGKAGFNPQTNAMEFDFEYTAQIERQVQAELDRLSKMAGQMDKLKKDFDALVAAGDKDMLVTKLESAIKNYSDALKIFKDDKPVQAKLADAQAKLDALNANAAEEQKYQKLISEGQDFFGKKNYEASRAKFVEANTMRPKEKLPQDKIKEIDDIVKNKAKRDEFDALVSQGNERFGKADYALSIESYQAALVLFPDDAHCKSQIEKAKKFIDDALAAAKDKAEREKRFNDLLTLANRNFNDKVYQDARRQYEEALTIFNDDKHCKDRIVEIDRLIAELAAKEAAARLAAADDAEKERIEREYQAQIKEGDTRFTAENYADARPFYQAALGIKPGDKYADSRIKRIDEIIAELAAKEAANRLASADNAEKERIEREYQAKIKEADALFDSEKYETSKTTYQAALAIKDGDKYPKSRIQRIDEIIAERKRAELASNDENERKRQEDERLAQERQRLDAEKSAEAERLRKLEAERLERERLAKASKEKEEEDERRRRSLTNTDSSREDDVERYYREARQSEEAAKYNNIVKRKEEQETFLDEKGGDAHEARMDNYEEVGNASDNMQKIYRKGSDVQDDQTRDKAKEIEKWSSDEVERNEKFGFKRLENREKAEEKKYQLESIAEKDEHRMGRVEASEQKKMEDQGNQDAYESRALALTGDNEYKVNRSKEQQSGTQDRGFLVWNDGLEKPEEKKKDEAKFQQDAQKASAERLNNTTDKKEKQKDEFISFSEGKDVKALENQKSVDLKKESVDNFNESRAKESEFKRETALFEKHAKDSGAEKSPDDYILPEGSEDLQEGVNETSYELPGKTVIERTVKYGNKVDVYRKVISKTGTYFFKNNKSISEDTWKRDTLNLKD